MDVDEDTEAYYRDTETGPDGAGEGGEGGGDYMDEDEDEDVHVEVPSQDDIKQMLLARRKQVLLEQYASAELREEEQHTKELAGI
jgi:hypothetical protein